MYRGIGMKLAGAVVTLVAVGAIAGVANAAPGDVSLTGETAQGVKVKLTVGTAGNATKFKIGKTKVDCNQGGTLDNGAATYKKFDTSDPGKFKDKRKGESDDGPYHFATTSNLKGSVDETGGTWSGSFKLVNKVFKNGEKIDTCTLKTTWEASV